MLVQIIPHTFETVLPAQDASVEKIVEQRIGRRQFLNDPEYAAGRLWFDDQLGRHVSADGPVIAGKIFS